MSFLALIVRALSSSRGHKPGDRVDVSVTCVIVLIFKAGCVHKTDSEWGHGNKKKEGEVLMMMQHESLAGQINANNIGLFLFVALAWL